MRGRGLGSGHNTAICVVPERMLNAFVEAEFAFELYQRWENHAYDILPQSEGVSEGDWQTAGYDMDMEFPQVSMLANNYGKEWKDFLSRKDYKSDILWVISEDCDYDDFQTLMGDFLDDREWRDVETKDDVEKAIKEFQDIVRESTHPSYSPTLQSKKSKLDDAVGDGDDDEKRGEDAPDSNVFVSPDYLVDEPDDDPGVPDVCVEFNFENPINHYNCMTGDTWAVSDGDFYVNSSNPYDNLGDARKATWQCSLKFWNKWQDKLKKNSLSEIKNLRQRWMSAIEDGSWKSD